MEGSSDLPSHLQLARSKLAVSVSALKESMRGVLSAKQFEIDKLLFCLACVVI